MLEQTGSIAEGDEPDAQGRLGIVHADGRVYINETERRFDAAVMDAFSSNSVPAHLVTRETYERLRDIVDGPVYVNLIDAPDGPLARGCDPPRALSACTGGAGPAQFLGAGQCRAGGLAHAACPA